MSYLNCGYHNVSTIVELGTSVDKNFFDDVFYGTLCYNYAMLNSQRKLNLSNVLPILTNFYPLYLDVLCMYQRTTRTLVNT